MWVVIRDVHSRDAYSERIFGSATALPYHLLSLEVRIIGVIIRLPSPADHATPKLVLGQDRATFNLIRNGKGLAPRQHQNFKVASHVTIYLLIKHLFRSVLIWE